jgi:AAA15 family ATPase/GTPase
MLLAIAIRKEGLVLIDEVESGIYHSHQDRFAKALLALSREYQTQLFMTTHSDEWIRNFMEEVPENPNDVAFWRMERNRDQKPIMRRFTVAEFSSGMAAGEMR